MTLFSTSYDFVCKYIEPKTKRMRTYENEEFKPGPANRSWEFKWLKISYLNTIVQYTVAYQELGCTYVHNMYIVSLQK